MKRLKWVRPEVVQQPVSLPLKEIALCPKNLNGKKVSYLIVNEIDKFTKDGKE